MGRSASDCLSPIHHNDRCTTTSVLSDEVLAKLKRSARDPVTGKTYNVPANMTYAEWKKSVDGRLGQNAVDTKRKMAYNTSADQKQYDRYKERLGEDAPQSFAEFRKIKYENSHEYKTLKTRYADIGLQGRLRSNDEILTIKEGQQGKHIPGHNNYTPGRGYLTITIQEAQDLIRQYAGHGEIWRDHSGRWTHKEFVTADHVIGYAVDKDTGEETETRRFYISYATGKNKGSHIVPIKEIIEDGKS